MTKFINSLTLSLCIAGSLVAQEPSSLQDSQLSKASKGQEFEASLIKNGYQAVKLSKQGGQLLIELSIDGKKGWFLLDTGAMASLIQKAAIGGYNLSIEKANIDAVGVGGGKKIEEVAKTKKLSFGTLTDQSQSFYVTEMKHWPKALHGILGTDFLKAQNAIVDYSRGILWIKKELKGEERKIDTAMKANGYTKVKFKVQHNHLFLDTFIGDTKGRFIIDSGAGVTLLKESALKKYELEVIKGRAVINGFGGETIINALAKTKHFKLGGADFGTQQFYVINMSKWPQGYANRLDGILGSDFLESKNSLIDYSQSTLWLKL